MPEESRYVSPIYYERVDQEEFVSVCMEILRNARNEIYLSMRFLDVSLSSLYFAPDLAVRGIATDGSANEKPSVFNGFSHQVFLMSSQQNRKHV